MGEEGRLKAAWDKRRSTRLCEIHVGVSEALGLMGGLICAQQSLVVLGAEEGGSCGFTLEVKEIVVHKISKEASCVWFRPLQPGLAKLASPTKLSQQGPEKIFLLPRLGPQAQR